MTSFKTFSALCFLAFSFATSQLLFAQSDTIEWLNKNTHPIRLTDPDNLDDLNFLQNTLEGKKLVGLGEASHGTEEFFAQKSRIVKYLVTRDQFRVIAFECPASYIQPIDEYVQTGQGDLKNLLKSLGLYNSREMYNLITWMTTYNKKLKTDDRIKLIGFDSEEFWGDPLGRDENMAKSFIAFHGKDARKSILWSHNLHLAKDITMAQYPAMGFHLKKQYNELYYAVALDTFRGSVNVINDGKFESHSFSGSDGTFSSVFSKAASPAFFINFQKQPNPLINTQNTLTNIYSNWASDPKPLPIRPGADFDGLLFIRETTASREIE